MYSTKICGVTFKQVGEDLINIYNSDGKLVIENKILFFSNEDEFLNKCNSYYLFNY